MRAVWLPIVGISCIQLLSVMSSPVTIYPRDRRWIPDRFANEDFGMDSSYSHNSPSFDTNNGAPQMHQNYLSYYWPEYFSNGDNSPGDYTGMLFRANDGNRYDPVQQLQSVQTYSYGQMLKPYAYLGRSQQQAPAMRASDVTSRALLNVDLLNSVQEQVAQPQQQRIFFDSLTSPLSQQPLIVVMPNQGASSFQLPVSQVVQPQHESLLHLKPISNLDSHLQPNLKQLLHDSQAQKIHQVSGVQESQQPVAISHDTINQGHFKLPSNFPVSSSSHQNPMKLKLTNAQILAHQHAFNPNIASHQKPAAEEQASMTQQEVQANGELIEAEELEREVIVAEKETDQINQESMVEAMEEQELEKIAESNIEEAQVNEAEPMGAIQDLEVIQQLPAVVSVDLLSISENDKGVEELDVLAISEKEVEENQQPVIVSADQSENVEDVESQLLGEEIALSLTEKEVGEELEGRSYQSPPNNPYQAGIYGNNPYKASIYGNNPFAPTSTPLNLVYSGPIPPVPMRPPYYRPQQPPQYSIPQVYGYPSGISNSPAPGYGYAAASPPQQYPPPYPLAYPSYGYDNYQMPNGYLPQQEPLGIASPNYNLIPNYPGYYSLPPPPPRSERHVIPTNGIQAVQPQGKPHFG